jgi:hypothetical protein
MCDIFIMCFALSLEEQKGRRRRRRRVFTVKVHEYSPK